MKTWESLCDGLGQDNLLRSMSHIIQWKVSIRLQLLRGVTVEDCNVDLNRRIIK